jgi:ribonuclease HI
MLTHRLALKGIAQKHLRAYNVLTKYLHQTDTHNYPKGPTPYTDLPATCRTVNLPDAAVQALLAELGMGGMRQTNMPDYMACNRLSGKRARPDLTHATNMGETTTAAEDLPPTVRIVPDAEPGARPHTRSTTAHTAHATAYKRYMSMMQRTRRTPTPEEACILHNRCHGHYNTVRRVTASRYVEGQKQLQVEWAPHYMQQWAIDLQSIMGYKCKRQRPARTPEEVSGVRNQHALCEYCDKDDDTLVDCERCLRTYHPGCLPNDVGNDYEYPDDDPDQLWVCPECWKDPTLHRSREHQWHKVEWHPTFEPREDAYANAPKAVEKFESEERRRNAQHRGPRQRPDSHLSNLEKQGNFAAATDTSYCTTLGDKARTKLITTTQRTNPHTDIHPTGRHTITIRKILQRHKGRTNLVEVACLHSPWGDTIATLNKQRADLLYNNYQTATGARHTSTTFCEDLRKLLTRYREGAKVLGTDRAIKLKNHWATPREVYRLLKSTFKVTKERFASPLNHNPDFAEYWSAHEEDQKFGARWDAYSCLWTGYSVANPEYEDEDMDKAVMTALKSATLASTPTMTVLVLPAWTERSNTSYMKWVRMYPSMTKVLMKIPRKCFKFTTPDANLCPGKEMAGHPKWDVHILLVGNKDGYENTIPKDSGQKARWKQNLCNRLAVALNKVEAADRRLNGREVNNWWKLDLETAHNQPAVTTRGMAKAPTHMIGKPPDHETHQPLSKRLRHRLTDAFPDLPPLKYDWTNYTYTDGSIVGDGEVPNNGAGAGAYTPAPRPDREYIQQEAGDTTHIALDKTEPETTINRAELVAILVALRQGRHKIMTDSMSSIYQIHKMLHYPHNMTEHRHAGLIREIVCLVASGQQQTELVKVKSHTGILGNEIADELANRAAKMPTMSTPGDWVHPLPNSNDRHTQHWPRIVSTVLRGDREVEVESSLRDLTDQNKQHMTNKHRLGHSNTDTIYYKLWQDKQAYWDPKYSYEYLKDDTYTYAERKHTIQYRTGTLYTQKKAKQYGHSDSDRCTVCGEVDGTHHAIGACPGTLQMRMERHNKAGRLIASAIAKGRQGNSLLAMADVGSSDKLEYLDIAPVPRRVPEHVWNGHPPTTLPTTIPDLLLLRPPTGAGKPCIQIIELKYARDIGDEHASTLARTQHSQLDDALRRARPDCEVRYTVLILGTGGTILRTTVKALEDLGLEGNLLNRTCKELHRNAIHYLHAITSHRNKNARKARKTTPKGVT